jgi:inosose dehydratase
VIAYLKHLPGTVLVLCQMPGKDRNALKERQQHCLACCNAIGKRAADVRVTAAFHPNSPPGSVFRIEDDYEILMAGLSDKAFGFAPDAGHIAKGGMDPVEIFRRYSFAIRHAHFKDMAANGAWAEMGAGAVDFTTIIADLGKAGYTGWIMVEDESPRAEIDPDLVTLKNGKYVGEKLDVLVRRRGYRIRRAGCESGGGV